MAFVEKRKRGTHVLYYLAKTVRENSKTKKKRVFLGTDLNPEQLEKLVEGAKVTLGELDFDKILSQKEINRFKKLKEDLNRAIGTFDPESVYQHFLAEFTYDSNAIEGSSLTLQETDALLFEGVSPENKPMRHVQEAKNHKNAFDFVMNLKRKRLDQATICRIQKLVVEKTFPNNLKRFEGELRGVNVRVGTHIAPPHYSVPRRLGALIKWFNSNYKKYNPIVVSAYFHSEFENIHPFVDGNGRTGRLLMNVMLKKAGFPLITIFFKYRQEYYSALEKAREKKDFKTLIKLMEKCYADMLKTYSPKG